jgi:hypothetical protein
MTEQVQEDEYGKADGVLLIRLFREGGRLKIIAHSYDNANDNQPLPFEELIKCWYVLGEEICDTYQRRLVNSPSVPTYINNFNDTAKFLELITRLSIKMIKSYNELSQQKEISTPEDENK